MTEQQVSLEIAIPYVGSEHYLREAVASVIAQDDSHWSLLVLIDGPNEPAVEVWLDALEDPRVRHERHQTNLGLPASFQRCLEAGTTSHVTILGCDDLLLPSYVRIIRRTLEEYPGVTAVLPGVQVVDASGAPILPLADRIKRSLAPRRKEKTIVVAGSRLLGSLMIGNWAYFPLTCWNRQEALSFGFRPDLTVTLDLALWTDLVLNGGRLALPSSSAGSYRRHDASVSARTAVDVSRFAEESSLHREIAEKCRRRGWRFAALLATIRPTSRLHAALHVVGALRRRELGIAGRLLRFVVT